METQNFFMSKEIIFIYLSYLLGCFSTGYYLVRLLNADDIRNHGSHATGATNVGRKYGKIGFTITLLGDAAKGAIVVWASFYFELTELGVILIILAVVLGHNWPIQLKFSGGKGIATAAGAILVFNYQLLIVLLVLFGIVYFIFRKYTLSGLIIIVLTPIVYLTFDPTLINELGITALILIILIAHRNSIRDLVRLLHKK